MVVGLANGIWAKSVSLLTFQMYLDNAVMLQNFKWLRALVHAEITYPYLSPQQKKKRVRKGGPERVKNILFKEDYKHGRILFSGNFWNFYNNFKVLIGFVLA